MKYLKEMGKQFLKGKNIMRTSLPVMKSISDHRAQTQVLPEHLLLPQKIQQLMNSNDQQKVFESFFDYYFNLIINIIKIQEKPFNPMMCETFSEIYQIDSMQVKIFGEQIENHPPTTLYKIIFRNDDKNCMIYSKSSLEADIHTFSIQVLRKGWNVMQLSNGYTFIFNIPTFDVKNFMFGQRYGIFRDQSQIYWSDKHQDINIFTITEEYLQNNFNKFELQFEEDKKDNKQKYHIYLSSKQLTIQGNISNGSIVLLFENNQKYQIQINYSEQKTWDEYTQQQNIILSDSRTRKDILLYKEGKEDDATKEKIVYEERQRADRKLRNSE